MKWIVMLSLFSFSATALNPMVFMRDNSNGKQIMLKEEYKETALTQGPNVHLSPDISPDGKWVTWVEGASERNTAVVLYNRETRSRELFETTTRGMALQPRFSQNGKLIFFSAPTASGNKIAVINPEEIRARGPTRTADDARVYQLRPATLAHTGEGYFPQPSADGSVVVFQRNTFFSREIVEHDLNTKVTRVLARGTEPALSVDETLIAYVSTEGRNSDIWLVDRRSNNRTQLTNDPKDETGPTFMSDGTVVFASNRQERFQLYQAISGEWRQLVDSNSDDTAANFAGHTDLKQTTLAPMLAPLRSAFAALSVDEKVYVCGGKVNPGTFANNLQVYDHATNAWQELAPRPHRAHSFQLAAHGPYLYAFGGFAYDASTQRPMALDVIDRYDLRTNEWITIGKLPSARASHVVATIKGKAYLIGGVDASQTFLSAVDVFDLETEAVSEASWAMPSPLRRDFSAAVIEDRIYLVAGLGTGSPELELLSTVTQLNPQTGFSMEMKALPFATLAPGVGVLGDELMVFGGMVKTSPQQVEDVAHIYSQNVLGTSWRHRGRFLPEGKGFAQVVALKDGLVVLGGHQRAGDRDEPVGTVEFFSK